MAYCRRKRLAALEKALHPSPLDNSTAGDIECSPNTDPISDLEKQDQKPGSVVQVVGGGSVTSLRRQDELHKGPREVLLSDSRMDRDTVVTTRKSISSSASSPKAQPRLIWSNLACSSIRTDIYKGGELKEINEVLEPYLQRIETTMQEVSEFLRTLRQRMDEEDEEEEENYDWHFVAMVVDRFCLFLFSGAILFASSFILINAPRLFSA
ncbi:unnamed protein product [Anisakis simplex]|uniref:Neur_chan_memb domain-containing protein n=1 Tax=Anisakis simplex TaxID=6269 RepID=A0A0M3KAZ6_ANISI|nr:unnamed protein product [Anisakis simplex]